MTNLLKAESLKLRKSFGFWTLMGVFAAVAIYVSYFYNSSAEQMASVGAIVNGINGFYWAMDEIQVNVAFIGFFVAIFVCSEFRNRTISVSILSGLKRSKLLFAKIGAMLVGTVILMSVQSFVAMAFFTITRGFGGSLVENFAPMLRVYGLYLLGCVTTAAVCALIAYAIRNLAGAVGACIGVNIFLSLAVNIPIEAVQKVLRFSYITQLANVQFETLNVPFYISVMVITIAAALVGAVVVFEKSELK
jgi:ABC-type transport system involved in multi-copper enzyme maturation permease subunit